jgi:hypothetical protein
MWQQGHLSSLHRCIPTTTTWSTRRRATRSSAKAYAENYDPRGKISSKFDTKAEAEAGVAAGVAFNIEDPDSSDSASAGADSSGSETEVKPRARRGGLIPPGHLPTSTEPLLTCSSKLWVKL